MPQFSCSPQTNPSDLAALLQHPVCIAAALTPNSELPPPLLWLAADYPALAAIAPETPSSTSMPCAMILGNGHPILTYLLPEPRHSQLICCPGDFHCAQNRLP